MLQIISDKEDHKAIALEIFRLVTENIQATPVESKPEIMTGEQVCEKLAINIQTLATWRQKGKIPFMQIGSAIRYDFNKVIAAIEVTKNKRASK
jgi:hypothetical protein